jgi:type IV pilus biogenesis/stability protein PilW
MIVLSVLGVCGGCAATTAEQSSKLADIHLRLGVSELYQNHGPKAIEELLLALKHDPENADAHYTLAFAYQGRHLFDKAVEHLLRAVALRPDFSDAYNNLGALYLQLERYDEAIPMFRKALANVTYATPYLAYGNLGWTYFKKGELRRALKHLKTALFHNPKFCQGHNNVGVVLAEMGDQVRAAEELELALKHCPKYVEAHYRLGLSHLKMRNRELASTSFRSCEALAPESDLGRECARYLKRLQ